MLIQKDTDLSIHTPLLEPYDKGDRCLIYLREGNKLQGVMKNVSLEEGTAYVEGFVKALQEVKDSLYLEDK